AYTNLGLSSSLATITNKYVRFKPSSVDQLATLDSTMDAQGLETFDTPVDYNVTYEGDYYQDPAIPEEQVTWQYAVVPPNFIFPAGIQYEIIAQIHIPGDNYTAIETEAERLASIQDGLNGNSSSRSSNTISPNVADDCLPGWVWDPRLRRCINTNCPTGYYWDGDQCVPNNPPPPPPAPDAAVPAGNITVFDNNFGTNLPVRKARVVARRWYKIERVFTDINGHYIFTKRFKDKVRINVKFKNADSQIRAFRGARLWQMLYAVQRTLGIFSGNKSAIDYLFLRIVPENSKGMRYWAAATVHNAVQDYRGYAPQEGIALPPSGLKIILSSWGRGSAATPLFGKRVLNGVGQEFVLTFLATAVNPIVGGVAAAIVVLKKQVDIALSYNIDLTRLNSDRLKETTYHELTHSGHYTALGNGWYTNFVDKEISEIISNFGNPTFSPYGGGNNSYSSPIIALGESWAYYMGHFLANRTYGLNSGISVEQGIGYTNNNPLAGLSSHLNLLEDFSPFRTTDPFHWIPQGLFYDLNDARNETTPVLDQVSGYSNQQMFNSFQSTIYTLQDYRVRLLQTTANPTSGFVPNLFSLYGY
ncbi:MAG TPA: hypothetical protein VGP55_08880, partial [Chitinophagaceae bacterium]|nr:hypothetical protein [Chitinophagaceae bacterium]